MKHVLKYVIAIIIYAVLVVIVDLVMGMGILDQWGKLMKWAKK